MFCIFVELMFLPVKKGLFIKGKPRANVGHLWLTFGGTLLFIGFTLEKKEGRGRAARR